MKILHIIDNSVTLGGAEKILLDIVDSFTTYSSEISQHLITTNCITESYSREIEKLNVEYTHIPFTSIFDFFTSSIKLRKYVEKNKIDIVHAHLYNSILFSRIVRGRNTKLFFTYHNLDYLSTSIYHSKWRVLLDKITYSKKDNFIFVSKAVQLAVENQLKILPEKSHVVSNFPDKKFTRCYDFKNNDSLNLIAIGNLKKVKNYVFLIEAVKKYSDKRINLDIIGEGPFYDDYVQKSRDIKVNILGKKNITSELHNKYDAIVMSSFTEGMPIVLLEAMASGLPAILPDHLSVMRELAENGGFYYSIKDIKSLHLLFDQIISNKNILKEKSEYILERSILFSGKNYVEKMIKIYSDSL